MNDPNYILINTEIIFANIAKLMSFCCICLIGLITTDEKEYMHKTLI